MSLKHYLPCKYSPWYFRFLAGKHRGCLHPFDGPGGVFAHAFYPDEGDLHFDADENWTDGVYHGTNLYSVTLHEIGHLLGLRHSNKATAIMHETYKAYDPNMKLTTTEKLGINFIYGKCIFHFKNSY